MSVIEFKKQICNNCKNSKECKCESIEKEEKIDELSRKNVKVYYCKRYNKNDLKETNHFIYNNQLFIY